MQYPSLHQPGGFQVLASNAGHNPTYGVYQLGFETRPVPSMFAVYIPPGTVRAEMYLYLPTSSPADPVKVSCAVRFGAVPSSTHLALDNWDIYPFDSSEYGASLDGKTYVPAPTGDHCTVINRNYSRNPVAKGDWLNVNVLAIKGYPFRFGYAVDVKEAGWKEWLASVQWDASGNPTGTVTTPVPLPDPETDPTPVPVGKVTVVVNGTEIVTTLPLKIKVKQ
jgi:hypothetical protein